MSDEKLESLSEENEGNSDNRVRGVSDTETSSDNRNIKSENTSGNNSKGTGNEGTGSEDSAAEGEVSETQNISAQIPEKSEPKAEHVDNIADEIEVMTAQKAMRIFEAILFANGDEVYYEQFAKIVGYTKEEAIKVVETYAKLYDNGAFPRGIKLVCYEDCCQLVTYPELGKYVKEMIGIKGEPQLSASAMETLAIIAYNQPVTRAYIEQVRQVDSTRPITVLLDRELIEEKGRLDVIGRPRLFGTTQNFLRTFGISSLAELPALELFVSGKQ